MLAASFLFAFMGYFVKKLAPHMSSIEIVFFRNIFAVVIIYISFFKKPIQSKGGRPWLLVFRGLMGFSALMAYFYNITQIPLAEAITYTKTSPIFTAVFAYIFLQERLPLKGWFGVFVGFLGIVFIMKPEFGLDKYDILGILSGVGAALAYTAVRELREHYDTRVIVMSFALTGTIGALLAMVVAEFWRVPQLDFLLSPFVMPEGVLWIYIIIVGTLATLSQLLMTKAYAITQAGIVGVISYTNILFSIILGLFLGEGWPDTLMWIGISMIILSGAIISKK
jgi:drug/metabolite transporter (DMT)-like permease